MTTSPTQETKPFLKDCIKVPLSEVTSVGGKRNSKRQKLASYPNSLLARSVQSHLSGESPGNVFIRDPHDVAAVYMSGLFGKGSRSKGPPVGCLDGSEYLILTPCEALYLSTTESIVILNESKELIPRAELCSIWSGYNAEFPHKYQVYKHFRGKGYVVRSGLTYGGDFVLYTGDPGTCHALYVVKVVVDRQSLRWDDVNTVRRVSESVAKECVLAFVSFGRSDCLSAREEGCVTTVLLKRWIPSRDREIGQSKNDCRDSIQNNKVT